MKNVLELIEFEVKLPVISHLESEAGGPEGGRAPVPFPLLWLELRALAYTYSTHRCPVLLRTGEDNGIKLLYLLHKGALILSTLFFSLFPELLVFHIPLPLSILQGPGWELSIQQSLILPDRCTGSCFLSFIYFPQHTHTTKIVELYLALLKCTVKRLFLHSGSQTHTWNKAFIRTAQITKLKMNLAHVTTLQVILYLYEKICSLKILSWQTCSTRLS